VRFEAPPRAPDDALPRMDIAFFVGFAASGPLTVPVAVESLAEFETVFGAGIVLARDAVSGEPVKGLLHPAVRGFFSQGGRRCWVLRVAGGAVRTSRFALPGLLCAQRGGPGAPWRLGPAMLPARSPGSGADDVLLAARVQGMPLRVRPLAAPDDGPQAIEASAATTLAPRGGDLLRLVLGGLYVHGRIAAVDAARNDDTGRATQRIVLGGLVALRRLSGTDSPAATPASIGLPGLDEDGGDAMQLVPALGEWSSADRLALRIRIPARRLPRPGEVVWLDFSVGGQGWMALDSVDLTEAEGVDGQVGAELAGVPWQEARGDLQAALDDWRAGAQEGVAQVLRLDLHARTGPDGVSTLDGLPMGSGAGVDAAVPGVFELPDDEQVFARAGAPAGAGPAVQAIAQRDALGRLRERFPLAAGEQSFESLLLPLSSLDDFGVTLGSMRSPLDALARDGLTAFHWSLFAEPALADASSDVLADRAEAMRDAGRTPRPLRGMHAAFGADPPDFVDEPTLLAIPDAVHAGWRPLGRPASPWTELPPLPEPPGPGCDAGFADCDAVPLARPRFVRGADPLADGRFTLYWAGPAEGAYYELQEAIDAGFGSAATIFSGPAARHDVPGHARGLVYYRVRASVGRRISPWSAPVRIEVGAQGYETLPWQDSTLQAIHRLMLRTAAGRGDMLAVLALPAHFGVPQCVDYAAALRTTRGDRGAAAAAPSAIGDDELRALSHGALHHPWPVIRRDTEFISFPPDGPVCGQLAAGALERGAWIAVANRPLRDVVALGPPGMRPALQQRQQMLDAQVNLLRCTPIGFVVSGADTLTPDAEWRPVNVRRLMCLLRRLALRRGVTYVFEPNGDTLRRTVERSFEAALDSLFRRGAFAGARPEAAYRVNVSEALNTPRRRDMGQFWVELQVAPALPMSFLTVRLSRNGERVLSREVH
jgi:hypothetical protein